MPTTSSCACRSARWAPRRPSSPPSSRPRRSSVTSDRARPRSPARWPRRCPARRSSSLTPSEDTDATASARVGECWKRRGAEIDTMAPDHHDRVLAITSHLPHLIAYTIVGTASDMEEVTRSEVIKYSAGGFRDFTRIAASDPTMWRDVFLANREAVLDMLQRFSEDLTALQRAIRWGKGDELFDLFSKTRAIRRGVIDEGQDAPAPDFGARQTWLNRRSEAERDDARLRGAPARPQPAAVERHRDHRQLQRAVETGAPRQQRRQLTRGAARFFRKDQDRAAFRQRCLSLAHDLAQRAGRTGAIDDDDAIASRDPAPDRDARQFLLHDARRRVEQPRQLDRLVHRLVLGGVKSGARPLAFDPVVHAHDVACRPAMEPRPANGIADQHRPAEERGERGAQHDRRRPAVKHGGARPAAQPVHAPTPCLSANLRISNLLYSATSRPKRGLLGTPSPITVASLPSSATSSSLARARCQSDVTRRTLR